MPFHYLFDLTTGRLLTEVLDDDVLPDPLPAGVGVVTRAERWISLRDSGVGWDEAARNFVAKPLPIPRDLAQEIVDQPELAGRPSAIKTAALAAADRVLSALGLRFQ